MWLSAPMLGAYNLWACKGVPVGGVQFGCLQFVDLLRVGQSSSVNTFWIYLLDPMVLTRVMDDIATYVVYERIL